MSRLLWALPAASIALVLLASWAQRAPVRFPRRFAAPEEEGALRTLHRALQIHLAAAAAALALVFAAGTITAGGVATFLLAWLLARGLGFLLAGRRPMAARWFAPLMAPVDGAALLLDWGLSPLLRRGLQEPPAQGSPEAAYEQVLELSLRTVEQVMVPRSEMAWLQAGAKIEEIQAVLRRRPHSRYPVFQGDFEQLVGMVELVDLLKPIPAGATAANLAHAAVVVPETMLCDDLLDKMQRERFDTGVVVDEFGAIAGLTTLEDLLEVLVGDLTGEHESVPVRVQRLEENVYQIDAALRIDEFEHMFGVPFPEGDYETLAGLYLSQTYRIPAPGEKVTVADVRLEVLQADARRIRLLRVVFLKPPPRQPARTAPSLQESALPG
jgi:Mg2+/Co2+ transporter CorC